MQRPLRGGTMTDPLHALRSLQARKPRGSDPASTATARIAIVGAGISGLGCAHTLQRALGSHVAITVFEAADYIGGHTHTVDVTVDGITHGVDTGFLVFNERTYPKLIALLAELGVHTAESEMSFSVRMDHERMEWAGTDLNSVFAQRANLLRPRFLEMLADIMRFNKLATRLAASGDEIALRHSVGEFLHEHRFSQAFRDWYFLPMVAAIWSCPERQMLRFPMAAMLRFCHNHGLLQVSDRPRWFTVAGGAREYVRRILRHLPDVRSGTPVRRIVRTHNGVSIETDRGTEAFDEVVIAAHSDQALAMLADPTLAERDVLGAISYQDNHAILHTDTAVLPRAQRAWAAWNYHSTGCDGQTSVGVHYLINKLQPVPFSTPVIVSLNSPVAPDPASVIRHIEYAHPVFDAPAIRAQRLLPQMQGEQSTWYCGAWTGYGFHEDGLKSGLAVAEQLIARYRQIEPEYRAA
jgi:predicted NAD/FAD-binding protein